MKKSGGNPLISGQKYMNGAKVNNAPPLQANKSLSSHFMKIDVAFSAWWCPQ